MGHHLQCYLQSIHAAPEGWVDHSIGERTGCAADGLCVFVSSSLCFLTTCSAIVTVPLRATRESSMVIGEVPELTIMDSTAIISFPEIERILSLQGSPETFRVIHMN